MPKMVKQLSITSKSVLKTMLNRLLAIAQGLCPRKLHATHQSLSPFIPVLYDYIYIYIYKVFEERDALSLFGGLVPTVQTCLSIGVSPSYGDKETLCYSSFIVVIKI